MFGIFRMVTETHKLFEDCPEEDVGLWNVYFENTMTYLSKGFEQTVLDTVFWYNRTYLALVKWSEPILQSKHFVIELCVSVYQMMCWVFDALWKRTMYMKIEPYGNWLYSAALVEYPGIESANPTHKLLEIYTNIEPENGYTQMESHYSIAQNTISENALICEILLIARDMETDAYFVRSCQSLYREIVPILPRQESEVEFLCIEYRHPKMSTYVPLHLPKSMYMVGNELFTSAFVLRCLEHQPLFISYKFDTDYIITLLDNNIHQYTLRSNEYIVLEKTDLRVCRVDDNTTPKGDDEAEYLAKFERMYI